MVLISVKRSNIFSINRSYSFKTVIQLYLSNLRNVTSVFNCDGLFAIIDKIISLKNSLLFTDYLF